MIDQFPYPDAEHYIEPTNPTELLADELRLYKDSFSMRLGLEGLKNMYFRAPIFDAFAQISNLIPVAKRELQGNVAVPSFDHEFFDGNIYALHAFVRPSSITMKEELLNWVPLHKFEHTSNSGPQIDIMIDELMAWESVTYQESFNQQPVDFQEKIAEVAARINEGVGDTRKAEDSFISGFLFSSTLIWKFIETRSQENTSGNLDDVGQS